MPEHSEADAILDCQFDPSPRPTTHSQTAALPALSRDLAADAGEFVRLSAGFCHYRFDGPATGRPLLLIHGATVPGWEFDRLVPSLHVAGYRTLRPDLFGHGYSDRPLVCYDLDLFVTQLLELLEVLAIASPLAVIGHSLGAALAARLLAARPADFAGAVLGAPLVDYLAMVPSSRLLLVPGLGELLARAYVVPMLKRRRRRNYGVIEDGRFVAKFMRQLALPGFERALVSMFRHGALGPQHACYTALGQFPHPVLVLTGTRDAIVSHAQIRAVLSRLPAARHVELTDAMHSFMLSEPERAARPILDFLADLPAS